MFDREGPKLCMPWPMPCSTGLSPKEQDMGRGQWNGILVDWRNTPSKHSLQSPTLLVAQQLLRIPCIDIARQALADSKVILRPRYPHEESIFRWTDRSYQTGRWIWIAECWSCGRAVSPIVQVKLEDGSTRRRTSKNVRIFEEQPIRLYTVFGKKRLKCFLKYLL